MGLENARDGNASGGLRYRGYFPALDVLRGVAVASVVVFHAFYGKAQFNTFPAAASFFTGLTVVGKNGVPLFFILSGFLISGILLDSREKPRYYKNFFVRRALRILPAYLLLLVALKWVGIVTWRFVLAALLYIANMAGLVGAHTYQYGVLWSLAVEEQFYLLWPFFVRHVGRSRLIVLSVMGILLLPFGRVIMVMANIDSYVNLPANADYLLLGALVALSLREKLLHSENIVAIYRSLALVGFLGLVPYVYVDMTALPGSWPVAMWVAFGRLIPETFFLSWLLYAVAHNTGAKSRRGVSRFFAFLGYLSYGLYLVHLMVFGLYDRWTAGTALAPVKTHFSILLVRFVICGSAATAIAWLSRRFYEERFLRLKERLTPTLSKASTQALDQTPV